VQNPPAVFEQFQKLSLETRAILVGTILLLITIPITTWAVEKKSQEVSVETFAAECADAEATVNWPSTPGCLVNRTVGWNTVSYLVKVFYPESLDPDKDGFTTEQEEFIGTDPADSCRDNSSDDAWPADLNNDGSVSGLDIFIIIGRFGTEEGVPGYSSRYDMTADGSVAGADIFRIINFFGETCGGGSAIPFMRPYVTGTSYSLSNLPRNTNFAWAACYPQCGSGNFGQLGSVNSGSSGSISFSWTGITYKVQMLDLDCGLFYCLHPGTPKSVNGLQTTLINLYPNRRYKLQVCYPNCNSGTILKERVLTTANCSGSGGTYSVKLKRNNSSELVKPQVFNLTSTSYTFRGLDGSTPYDFYVYSPSNDPYRVYKKGDVTSTSGTCNLTETQMKNLLRLKINVARQMNNLPTYEVTSSLNSAAMIRANEAAQSFSHTRPGGGNIGNLLDEMGIAYEQRAEILGRNNYIDDTESVDVIFSDFMNSPGHRGAILDSQYGFSRMGVGVVKGSNEWNYFAVVFIKP
jgi:uncharacterized protein YkwD